MGRPHDAAVLLVGFAIICNKRICVCDGLVSGLVTIVLTTWTLKSVSGSKRKIYFFVLAWLVCVWCLCSLVRNQCWSQCARLRRTTIAYGLWQPVLRSDFTSNCFWYRALLWPLRSTTHTCLSKGDSCGSAVSMSRSVLPRNQCIRTRSHYWLISSHPEIPKMCVLYIADAHAHDCVHM